MESSRQVNFYDFQKLHEPELKQKIQNSLTQIIDENSYVEGNLNDLFEEKFAKFLGAKNCLLVANGTDALQLSLQAIGVIPGDKVGIPGITFHATASSAYQMGAEPIFIDSDPATGLICFESLVRVHKQYKLNAIMPVHIYGMPAPMEKLNAFCKEEGIKIVEDAAQAHGAKYESGGVVGSGENLATFSFYPTKNLGAFGDAGAISFSDDSMKQKLISLRNHGRSPEGISLIGHNSRCDHMQAAVLLAKLDYLNDWNEKRRNTAKVYFSKLKGLPLSMIPEKFLDLSSWHLFPILTPKKNELRSFLADRKIGTSLFYEYSVPELPAFSDFAGEREKSVSFAAQSLCLPIHPHLNEEDLQHVVDSIHGFFA